MFIQQRGSPSADICRAACNECTSGRNHRAQVCARLTIRSHFCVGGAGSSCGRRLRAGAGPGPGGSCQRAAGPGPGGGRAAAGCGQRRLPTDGDADGGRTRPTDRSDRLMGAAAGCGWVGLRLPAGGGLRAAPAAVADGRRRTAGVLAGRQVIVVLTPPTACPRCTRAYEIWQ